MLRRSRRTPHGSDRSPNDERLRALVDEHAAAAYRMALSIVRDPALAEDVVQETMIKAWLALSAHRGDGSLRSWILSIAHNTAVSSLRRTRDEATAPDQMPDRVDGIDVERTAQGRADLAALAEALDHLDDLSRSILILSDLEAMPYAQIAETLEVTVPTVKTRLLRARREMQRIVYAGDPA